MIVSCACNFVRVSIVQCNHCINNLLLLIVCCNTCLRSAR